MPRVTTAQVKAILDTSITDAIVTTQIETADLLIDEELANVGLSAARLAKISLYLAAHFCTVTDRQVKSEGADGVTATYDGATGMGLSSSIHGQQALALDTTGRLRYITRRTGNTASLELV